MGIKYRHVCNEGSTKYTMRRGAAKYNYTHDTPQTNMLLFKEQRDRVHE